MRPRSNEFDFRPRIGYNLFYLCMNVAAALHRNIHSVFMRYKKEFSMHVWLSVYLSNSHSTPGYPCRRDDVNSKQLCCMIGSVSVDMEAGFWMGPFFHGGGLVATNWHEFTYKYMYCDCQWHKLKIDSSQRIRNTPKKKSTIFSLLSESLKQLEIISHSVLRSWDSVWIKLNLMQTAQNIHTIEDNVCKYATFSKFMLIKTVVQKRWIICESRLIFQQNNKYLS